MSLGNMCQLALDPAQILRSPRTIKLLGYSAGENLMLKLGIVLVGLYNQEHSSKHQSHGDKNDFLPDSAMVQGPVSQHDRQAAANEHKGVEGADPFDQVDIMRGRPGLAHGRHAVPQDDVCSNERGKEHYLGYK